MNDLTPADETRLKVIHAAMVCIGTLEASDEEVQAGDDALDLAVMQHATELLAERDGKP